MGRDIVDHYTYVLHGDGDIQEPVAQGAIAIIYCIPNTSSSNNSASGSQDYWANMSYAIG